MKSLGGPLIRHEPSVRDTHRGKSPGRQREGSHRPAGIRGPGEPTPAALPAVQPPKNLVPEPRGPRSFLRAAPQTGDSEAPISAPHGRLSQQRVFPWAPATHPVGPSAVWDVTKHRAAQNRLQSVLWGPRAHQPTPRVAPAGVRKEKGQPGAFGITDDFSSSWEAQA